MSLYGALFTGVSALNAQSQSMGMISNNIANVNTTGYKRNNASFSDLVTQEGRYTAYSPGGVRAYTQATVNQQGILQQSGSSTDAAISGDGFFVVQAGTRGAQEPLYTRAGSFSEDAQGFLRNASGFYLMGWPLNSAGGLPPGAQDLSSLQPVDVAFLNGVTAPTQNVETTLNLDAGEAVNAGIDFTRDITVYDTLGTPQSLRLNFNKTATNTWQITVQDPSTAPATTYATATIPFNGNGGIATGAVAPPLTYDAATGKVGLNITGLGTGIIWGAAGMTAPAPATGANGSAPQPITLDLTNVTQFGADYGVSFVNQDGAELGLRTGVSIDKEGYVVASFSNGLTRNLYKLPVATFTNVNGLEERSGNVYIQTQDSGAYNLREAGTSGAGVVAPSTLEASNVDLADEFSKMIVTQRAYSAGTKVISTADQMLQELLGIR
ncbi:flagellar hook protein FlgE [Arenibaculum pallidiluteum]|uniref:flagellar hook protein FlgE n=1 Tax=Arenibaculum pallidiluteum TaxID=2812559 RepID=UPI001A95E9CD|nr:flagellar hook protein FlgE [Arenibaculum pallidiluteum]